MTLPADDAPAARGRRHNRHRSARMATRTRELVGPHGYTLSITGAFTLTAAIRGFPPPLSAYLFVVGASLAMAVLGVVSRPPRQPSDEAVPALPAVNPVPLVSPPVAAAPAALIPPEPLAFLVSGTIASVSYVVLLSLLSRRRASPGATRRSGSTSHR